jgi:hypothetical protein
MISAVATIPFAVAFGCVKNRKTRPIGLPNASLISRRVTQFVTILPISNVQRVFIHFLDTPFPFQPISLALPLGTLQPQLLGTSPAFYFRYAQQAKVSATRPDLGLSGRALGRVDEM